MCQVPTSYRIIVWIFFLFLALVAILFSKAEWLWAILVQYLRKNYPIKSGWNPPSGCGGEEAFFVLFFPIYFVHRSGIILAILVEGHPRTFLWYYFEIWPLAPEEMRFKVCCFFFSIFYLWQPFCSAERNHFSNFGKGSPKEHFCKIILKSGHWPRRRCHLKVFYF